jgi:hypothetical protein
MIRPAVATDQAYIAKTWAKSVCSMTSVPGKTSLRFGHGHALKRHLGSDLWEATNKQIDAVMDREDSRAIVLCSAHDRNAITAYLVYAVDAGAPLVHYLYCRDAGRGSGAGAELLHHIGVARSTAVVCTSVGPSSEEMRARYARSTYLPLADFLTPGAR